MQKKKKAIEGCEGGPNGRAGLLMVPLPPDSTSLVQVKHVHNWMGSARINRHYELHRVCVPATTKEKKQYTSAYPNHKVTTHFPDYSVSYLRWAVTVREEWNGVVFWCGNIQIPPQQTVPRGWCGLHYSNRSGSWGQPGRQECRVLTGGGR